VSEPLPALYLFKSARRPRYRQENLQILSGERGRVLEIAYNRHWVAPEFFDPGTIRRGSPVVVVLTDRPYTRFCRSARGRSWTPGTRTRTSASASC
jgi:hypothetical protein